MSTTVDNRVVSMEFDNAKFEKNVEQSLNTLKSLDTTLNGMVDSAGKFDSISFNSITGALEDLASNFSFLGTLTRTIFQEISEGIVGIGEKLLSISFSNISAGATKYAEKTSSVQQIMAATGRTIEDVNASLERLNWYTDETSYNFVDMTGNIAKFTAQNIGLEEAEAAMEGIANWAASAGQRAETASRAMYNISQSMGAGYMMATDWRSIELANMATSEFKQVAIDTALAMGTLQLNADGVAETLEGNLVTIENFRENLSDKWFSKDVMMEVFGQYSNFNDIISEMGENTDLTTSQLLMFAEAMEDGITSTSELAKEVGITSEEVEQYKDYVAQLNSEEYALSKQAFKMAQEATTFTDAINAFGDAYSTAWMNVFELLFGNYEKARKLWTNLANTLYDVFVDPVNAFAEKLEQGLGRNAWEIEDAIAEAGVSLDEFTESFKTVAKNGNLMTDEQIDSIKSFDDVLSTGVFNIVTYKDALKNLANTSGIEDKFESTEEAVKSLQEVVSAVLRGDYGNGTERRSALEELGYDYEYIQDLVEKGSWYEVTEKDLSEAWLKTQGYTEEEIAALQEAIDKADELKDSFKEIGDVSGAEHLQNGYKNLMETVSAVAQAIRDAFSDVFTEDLSAKIYKVAEKFDTTTESIKNLVTGSDKLKRTFSAILRIFKSVKDLAVKVLTAFSPLKKLFGSIASTGTDVNLSILELIASFLEWISESETLNTALEKVSSGVEWVVEKLKKFIDSIKELSIVKDASGWFENLTEKIEDVGIVQTIIDEFKKFGELSIIEEASKWIEDFRTKVSELGIFSTIKTKFEEFKESISNLEIVKDVTKWFEDFKSSIKDIGVFETVANGFKELAESIQNGSAYESFIDTLKRLKDGFSDLQIVKDVKDWFKELGEELSKFGILGTLKKKFSNLWESLKNNKVLSGLIEKLEKLLASLNELQIVKDVKEWFSDLFSGNIIDWSSLLEKIANAFKTIAEAISYFIGLIFGKKGESIDDAFESIGSSKVESSAKTVDLISTSVTGLSNSLVTLSKDKDTTKFVEDITNAFVEAQEVSEPLSSNLQTVWDKIKQFMSLPNVTAIAGFIGIIVALKTLTSTVNAFNNVFSLRNALAGFFDSLKSGISSISKSLKYDAVIKVATAIGILVGAIAALCMLGVRYDVWTAVLQLSAIAVALAGLTAVSGYMSKIGSEGSGSLVTGILTLTSAAVAIIALASTLAVISAMKIDNITLTKLAAITAAIIGVIILTRYVPSATDDKVKGIYAVATLAIAIVAAAAALVLIGKMDPHLSKGAIESLIVVVGLMAILSAAAKEVKFSSGLGLISYILAIVIFEKYLQKIIDNAVSFKDIKSNLANLAITIGLIVALSLASKVGGNNSWSGGVGVLSMVLALLVIGKAIEKLGSIDTSVLLKGGAAIAALSVVFGFVISLSKGIVGIDKQGVSAIIAIVAAIGALVLSVLLLVGTVDNYGKLAVSVLAIVAMLSALSRIFKTVESIKVDKTSLAAISLITLIIAGLIAAMALLTALKPEMVEKYRKTATALAILLTTLAGVFYVLSKTKFEDVKFKQWGPVLAQVGVLMIIAAAALVIVGNLLSSVDVGVVVSLEALFITLAAAFIAISKLKPQVNKNNQFSKWLGPLSALALVAVAAGALLVIIGNSVKSVDLGVMVSLVALIATLSGALWLISKSTPNARQINHEAWKENMISLGIIVLLSGVVLKALQNSTTSIDLGTIVAFESLIAVLSGALWMVSKSTTGKEKIPWESWWQSVLSLLAIAAIAWLAMVVLQHTVTSVDPGVIISLETLIAVLAGALYVVSRCAVNGQNISLKQWIASIAALLVITAVAAGALILVSKLMPDSSNALYLGLALSAMILALAIAMAIVSACPDFDLSKAGSLVIASASMLMLVQALSVLATTLSGTTVNTDGLLQGVAALAIMIIALSLAAGIMSLMNVDMGAALEGFATIGIVVAAFLGVIAIIAAAIEALLGSEVITEEELEHFGNLMVSIAETLGTVIGAFVGGLVGGFNLGATSTLSQVATNLSDFATNIQPFMDSLKAWGSELGAITTGVLAVGEIFLTLAATEQLAAITAVMDFFGLADFKPLRIKFSQLGSCIRIFGESVADIDVTKVNAAVKVIDAFCQLYPYVDNEGGIFTAVVDFFVGNKDYEGLAAGMAAMGSGIMAFYNAIPTEFGDTELTRLDKFTTAFTKIIDAVKLIPNSGGLVGRIVGNNDVDEFMARVSGAVESTAKALETIKTNEALFGEGPSLVEPFANVLTSLNDVSKDIVNSGGWAGAIFGENDIDSFATHFKDSIEPMGTAMNELLTYKSSFADSDDVIDDYCEALKKVNAYAGDIQNSGGWIGEIFGENDLDTFATSLSNSVSPLATALDQMKEFTDSFSGGEDAVANFVDTINSLTKAEFTDLHLDFSGIFTTVVTDLKGYGEKCKNAFLEGFRTDNDGFKNGTLDHISIIAKAVTDYWLVIKAIGVEISNGIVEGIDSIDTNYGNSAVKCIDEIVRAVQNHESTLNDIGLYIVDGINRGIYNNAYKSYDAGYSLSDSAIQGANDRAAIQSPSKEFFKIGDYMGQGLVLGIKNEESSVSNVSEEITEAAIDSVSTMVTAIQDALNSDVDPVITPVLDLSEIKESSNEIGSLLNGNYNLETTRTNAFKTNSIFARTASIQNGSESGNSVVTLDENSLAAIRSQKVDVNNTVSFEGSLAQLGTILYPVIKTEQNRRGTSLIKSSV